MSSARNAPSPTLVSDGIMSAVDASTSLPMSAPSARSHSGVAVLAYSGKSVVRASSMSRCVAQTCHPCRLRTAWYPSRSPMPSSRTETRVTSSRTRTIVRAPSGTARRASPVASRQLSESRTT